MNPYDDNGEERPVYDEERIVKMLKDMHENGGFRCTECGAPIWENEEEVDVGTHRAFVVIIEEGEYGEPDEIHILCNKCAREFGWL